MVTVVGGPNSRQDYHINEGEEFFHQIEGDMVLRVRQSGTPVDIPIREGDIFLLPPKVPHSPQRPAGSIGMVIERKRLKGELDGFVWYCDKCNGKVFEHFFPLTNIVTQLPPIFELFYGNPANCTCKKCGHKMEKPRAPA
jgi:3-hydroxyanthranilate 3,4-dioxygenase